MTRYWTAVSDRDWEDSVGMYEEQGEFEEEPMDDEIAARVLVRLNTAIMALTAAMDAIPEEDEALRVNLLLALRYADGAERECKRRLEL